MTTFSPGRWLDQRYRLIFGGLLVLAALTRAALVAGAPRPFGYVWDLYHEGVVVTYEQGRLPHSNECWECYNPPLYFLVGAPLYALGASVLKGGAAGGLRALSWLSMACACVVVFCCHQTLRLLRPSRGELLFGTALALVFPCLFIASYGAENDALLTALMTAFFYRLCVYHSRPDRREAFILGVLAGLAALTKYSGLLALVTAVAVLGSGLFARRGRARAAQDLLIVVCVAAALCGWHYAQNWRGQGRMFRSPPGVAAASQLNAGRLARHWRGYDLHTFKVGEVVDLYRPGREGPLNDFPVYRSVLTTLHALAWSDMSFFSVPSRHGWRLPERYAEGGAEFQLVAQTPADEGRVAPYPPKRAAPWLVDLALRLGAIPTGLALLGFVAAFRRRDFLPFTAFTSITSAAYAWWCLTQDGWALKTKYVLFLLPVYVVCMVLGLRALERRDTRLARAATAGLIVALLTAAAYDWMFALG